MKAASIYLINEHEKIQAMLKVLKNFFLILKKGQNIPTQDWNELMAFFALYADQLHHAKEEDILIPALMKKGFPLKGGAYCTFYKQLQMMNTPLEIQIHEVEKIIGENPAPITADGNMPILVEHVLGRKLLKAMKLEFEKNQKDPSHQLQGLASPPHHASGTGWVDSSRLATFQESKTHPEVHNFDKTLENLIFQYVQFLEEHIEKENKCLFPMSDDTLSDEEQNKMKLDFEAFDLQALHDPVFKKHEIEWEKLYEKYSQETDKAFC